MLASLLSACGTPRDQVIAKYIYVPPVLPASLNGKVTVGDISGGSDLLFHVTGISSDMFKDVLQDAFQSKNMLAENEVLARYRVEADVTPDRSGDIGLDEPQSVKETVVYNLFENASHRQLFTTTITTADWKTASWGEVADPGNLATAVFFGPQASSTSSDVRMRNAYNQAVRKNITDFLGKLGDWSVAHTPSLSTANNVPVQ